MGFYNNADIIKSFFVVKLKEIFSYDNRVVVEMYRKDLSRLESDNKYWCRLGVYSGGNNPDGALPNMPRNRPLRVEHGKATETVQQYKIDISWPSSTSQDDGEFTELSVEAITDRIAIWVQEIGGTVYFETGGLLYTLIWGGCTQPTRPRKYATVTATIYALRAMPSKENMTPNKPTGLVSTEGADTVDLDWDEEENVDGYNVYFNFNGAGFVKDNAMLLTAPNYKSDSLAAGSYIAYVTSFKEGFESDASATSNFLIV